MVDKKGNSVWDRSYLLLVILLAGILTYTFVVSFLSTNKINFIPFLLFLLVITIFFLCINFSVQIKDRTEKMLKILEIFLLVMTVLISATQAQILLKQTQIQELQTQLLEQTSQANKPNIDLLSSRGYEKYPLNTFDSGQNIINMGAVNDGKTLAPYIRVKLLSSPQIISKSKSWEIQELGSLNYDSNQFIFGKNYENLTEGVQNITFSIECPYCDQTYKEVNISICIYGEISSILSKCGEKWT